MASQTKKKVRMYYANAKEIHVSDLHGDVVICFPHRKGKQSTGTLQIHIHICDGCYCEQLTSFLPQQLLIQ